MEFDSYFDNYKELRNTSGILGYGLNRRSKQLLHLLDNVINAGNLEELRILDFGCYDGYMLECIVDKYRHKVSSAIGLDIFPHGFPETKYGNKVTFRKIDLWRAFPHPFENESRNILVGSAFFKHHRQPSKFLSECHRILRPQGCLILLDPRPWVVRLGSLFNYFTPEDNPNVWSKKTIIQMLKSNHLEDKFQICNYEPYWIAPNQFAYNLGVEKFIPSFIASKISLHQSIVLKKL